MDYPLRKRLALRPVTWEELSENIIKSIESEHQYKESQLNIVSTQANDTINNCVWDAARSVPLPIEGESITA